MLLQRALYEDVSYMPCFSDAVLKDNCLTPYQALFCFRRANYKQGEDVANAYILYEEASALGLGEGARRAKELFAKAAQLFEQALFIQKAAETWGAAGQYKKAADVLRAHREYGKAALWYARVPDFMEAAECHHLAKQYDEAVIAYRKGEHFTELVTYLGEFVILIATIQSIEKADNKIVTRNVLAMASRQDIRCWSTSCCSVVISLRLCFLLH